LAEFEDCLFAMNILVDEKDKKVHGNISEWNLGKINLIQTFLLNYTEEKLEKELKRF
jgi:hypothetical protein